jgi:hypothetical protein
MSDDLPRYTWTSSANRINIMRRVGLYGQDEVGTWLRTGNIADNGRFTEIRDMDKEIANVICEYLDAMDRQRNGDTSERT